MSSALPAPMPALSRATSPLPAVMFAAILDDAAIFPPGDADMGTAVQDHLAWRRSPYRSLVGPFVCTATRFGELQQYLPAVDASPSPVAGAEALPVSLIAADAEAMPVLVRAALAESRIELRSLELPARADLLDEVAAVVRASAPSGVVAFVELPWDEVGAESCQRLAAAGLRLKVRTGGPMASAFPDPATLGRIIEVAVRTSVPFKLTAGLHHAVRCLDERSGLPHHGFLNVLAATAMARCGETLDELTALLSEKRPGPLLNLLRGLDQTAAAQVRRSFVSFGTCSIREPLDDLRALGAVADGARRG